MKNRISWIFFVLLPFVICIFALLPLFHAGYFTMHDDEQIGRLQQMFLVLSQGQFPPRWLPDLGFGFGYPLFNFYPPLVYYVGSLFHLVGFSFIDSTKIVMGLGFVLSSLAMFVWTKKHFGIIPGIFAAILYTYAPYHSVDLYVRGALSEFFSWIWIPAIFWAMDMLFETLQKKYIAILGIFLALLMLSHSLVMLQFVLIFPIYAAFLFLQPDRNFRKKLFALSLALLLGLGLCAYFWLPALSEKQYTLVDTILVRELANYSIHFVCPIQLWSSPWGYGGSTAGCVDGLSFQIGKIQILVGLVGILLSAFFVVKKKIFLPFAVGLVFLFSIFMTLPYSQFIWQNEKALWYIQFPWRYLLFVNVGSSFLGSFVLFLIQKKWGLYAGLLVGVVLSSLALYQVRNYFQPQAYRNVNDSNMTSSKALTDYVSSLSYEYVPKQVATKKSTIGTTQLAISQPNILRRPAQVVSGKMDITTVKDISYLKNLEITVYNQGILQLNTYQFPGWNVYVDGKKDTKTVPNKLDLIQISLPKGRYTVTAEFTETLVRNIADIVSIISLVGLIAMIWIVPKKL